MNFHLLGTIGEGFSFARLGRRRRVGQEVTTEGQQEHPPLVTERMGFETIHEHGPLFSEFLRARHEVFVDELGWALPTRAGMEFDQYDTGYTRYVVTHAAGEVLAGVRLVPTTAGVGDSSYMIRDAVSGRLDSIPANILDAAPPVDVAVVEASRVLVRSPKGETKSGAIRTRARQAMLAGMLVAADEMNATRIICILPTWWPRMKRFGLDVAAMGPVVDIGGPHQAVAIGVRESRLFQQAA